MPRLFSLSSQSFPGAALSAFLFLTACQSLPSSEVERRLAPLLPTQVLLLGEQHDAPEHQRIQADIVRHLAGQGRLAALVLEMADAGGSTAGLPAQAGEEAMRAALNWNDKAWPWTQYGPSVMAAVRAGVPVRGGNLPAGQMRSAMAQPELEQRLGPEALARQQALIRDGHCGLLPPSQITPMTRIQIARDLSMAQAVAAALPQAAPGQVVVLISGSVHADRALGVPLHLPADIKSASLRLQAAGSRLEGERFDGQWPTPPAPATDHCAGLTEQLRPPSR